MDRKMVEITDAGPKVSLGTTATVEAPQLPAISGNVVNEDGEVLDGDGQKKAEPTVVPDHLDHHGKLSWTDLKLSPELLKGIAAKGFTNPSKIQEETLPQIILERKGFVAQAVNGSGKTASFCLSILAICNAQKKVPQAICISHTHELARQNLAVLKELGQYTNFAYALAIPGAPPLPSRGQPMPQIICGTPGKITEMVQKRQLPLQDLEIMVLDEADVMIDPDQNFQPKIMSIHNFCPKGVQTLCFSATFKLSVRSFTMKLTETCTHGVSKVVLKDKALNLDCIAQHYLLCKSTNDKMRVLKELYQCMTIGQSVIFVNQRSDALQITDMMTKEGYAVSVLVGGSGQKNGMDTDMREKIMQEFRDGASKVLITTDILSRGIDVPAVTLVINYDLPYGLVNEKTGTSPHETYLHRIGRTGRFGEPGVAINLVVEGMIKELEGLKRLEAHYKGMEIKPIELDPEAIADSIKKLREKVESQPKGVKSDE